MNEAKEKLAKAKKHLHNVEHALKVALHDQTRADKKVRYLQRILNIAEIEVEQAEDALEVLANA